jgi:hypothetical protein
VIKAPLSILSALQSRETGMVPCRVVCHPRWMVWSNGEWIVYQQDGDIHDFGRKIISTTSESLAVVVLTTDIEP